MKSIPAKGEGGGIYLVREPVRHRLILLVARTYSKDPSTRLVIGRFCGRNRYLLLWVHVLALDTVMLEYEFMTADDIRP